MRAILIDPTLHQISEVDYDGDFRSIYRLLGEGVDCFDVVPFVRLPVGDTQVVFVDGEGLLKPEPGPFFRINGYGDILCGRGLILGQDHEGESVATSLSVVGVRRNVQFPAVRFVGFEDSNRTINHPLFGEMAVFERKAIFE